MVVDILGDKLISAKDMHTKISVKTSHFVPASIVLNLRSVMTKNMIYDSCLLTVESSKLLYIWF